MVWNTEDKKSIDAESRIVKKLISVQMDRKSLKQQNQT